MNKELLEKARAAESPEELLKLAHKVGMDDFTEENAKAYFETMHHSGEIADEDLDVSAGGCYNSAGELNVTLGNLCSARNSATPQWICKQCKQPAALCRCLPEASDFEESLGFAFKSKVKNACETCEYIKTYLSGGNYICSNPNMKN